MASISDVVKNAAGAFVVVSIVMAIPTFLVDVNTVSPVSDLGDVVIAFVQLVALFFPALAIFAQVLLEYSYRRTDQSGKSGGIGPYRSEVYRAGVIFVVGGSAMFLLLGVIALIAALEIPPAIEAGAFLIMLGMVYAPIALFYVGFVELRDA